MTDRRTPVVLVSGWHHTAAVAADLLTEGTVLVHHDLDHLREGVVRRTVTTAAGTTDTAVLELAHGCVSCTLREDLLPLLRRLHARDSVRRIALHLDRTLDPETVCRAIEEVHVTGVVGQLDGPASRDVRIDAVLTCIDAATWLADATGSAPVSPSGPPADQKDSQSRSAHAVTRDR